MRLSSICLWLWVFALTASADDLKCDICGQPITGNFYTAQDLVTAEKKNICQECHKLEARCFACDLPVKEGFLKLPDGRYLCARDLKDAVTSDEEAQEISVNVRNDLDRMLSRFLTFPDTNVIVSVGDKYQLENLFKAPGYEDGCVTIYGATQSNPLAGRKFIHHVTLLSHLKKSRLMAVCAHEFTHTWIGENLPHQRKLLIDRDTVEGFCEFVAYKYMESLQNAGEMKVIKKNNYTKGQVHAFIAADKAYGFDTVMEWMKLGEDARLDIANLDRIRAVRDSVPVSPPELTSALLYVPPPVPTPVPAVLELKGISVTPQRRFALINDTTLEAQESGKVRMGQTNITVRCLEIRSNSVVVEVNGSPDKRVLVLGAK